ncbi:MAG: protein-L-isoaspartate(D-aspartate) O-methyltransferase [Chloroflexi bacterium]|nr:protein-L-isoaspartate(D-aspartate) O-methyltransferase [Chloroflexota bacterium]
MKDSDYAEERFREMRFRMMRDQIKRRGVVDERVLEAFTVIPRHCFVPDKFREQAYQDAPLPIGYEQTISQPFIVALMTELLHLERSESVLEVGTGSGYQAAILACLCAKVITLERIPQLVENAETTLRALGIENVSVHHADGSVGWSADAPYDAILVTAGTPQVPDALKNQLSEGGRMILPVGSYWYQELQLWKKAKGVFTYETIIPVVFVPLIGDQGWEEKPPRNTLD